MKDTNLSFASPVIEDTGLIVDRKPQTLAKSLLPADLKLVSADNHIELTRDIFYETFPERLRENAPRVWFDKYWRVGFPQQMEAYPPGVDIDRALTSTVLNAGFEFDVRYDHLDAEGVDKEIVYPQSFLGFIRYPDQEMQELMYRTYNEHMAALGRESNGRFFGVGICSNWWDPGQAESAVRQIVDLGLKSFMLPYSPGKDVAGNPIDFAGETMDRLWAVAEEAGLPVNFHIGEVPASGGRGGFGTFFLVQAAPFRRVFGNLIFGGILDRHPGLKIVFAEGGINWVAGALQDAELTFGAHRKIYDWRLTHNPSHYWFNNMYATFQTDRIGLKLLDDIGSDRVMWAQDYPHGEGTFGYTSSALAEILAVTSETNARKIMGETAVSLYGLE